MANRICCTAMTGRIMMGRTNAAGNAFVGQKTDVTSDVLKAVIDKAAFHGGSFEIAAGEEKWDVAVTKVGAAPAAAVAPAEVDLPDVEDMAHSALQEALSFGLGHDVLHRWMRAVMDKTVAAMLAAAPTQEAALLDFIQAESLDLRCFEMPTGQGDADIGWRTVQHHMDAPHERVASEVYADDPRQAVREAMVRLARDPYCLGELQPNDAAAPTQEADGWMPIETAPDGERVLLGPRHAPVVGTVHRPAHWHEEQEPTATVVHYNGNVLVAGYRCSEWHRLPEAGARQDGGA